MDKTLEWFWIVVNVKSSRYLFELPAPVLFLCMIVALWWSMLSADENEFHPIDSHYRFWQCDESEENRTAFIAVSIVGFA